MVSNHVCSLSAKITVDVPLRSCLSPDEWSHKTEALHFAIQQVFSVPPGDSKKQVVPGTLIAEITLHMPFGGKAYRGDFSFDSQMLSDDDGDSGGTCSPSPQMSSPHIDNAPFGGLLRKVEFTSDPAGSAPREVRADTLDELLQRITEMATTEEVHDILYGVPGPRGGGHMFFPLTEDGWADVESDPTAVFRVESTPDSPRSVAARLAELTPTAPNPRNKPVSSSPRSSPRPEGGGNTLSVAIPSGKGDDDDDPWSDWSTSTTPVGGPRRSGGKNRDHPMKKVSFQGKRRGNSNASSDSSREAAPTTPVGPVPVVGVVTDPNHNNLLTMVPNPPKFSKGTGPVSYHIERSSSLRSRSTTPSEGRTDEAQLEHLRAKLRDQLVRLEEYSSPRRHEQGQL